MAKIEFGEENKRKGFFDFPKLALEKNEKARVCVLETPDAEYVHTLRKIITENGKPVMRTDEWKTKTGTKTKEVPDMDFVGKYICLGDAQTVKDKAADPDNCPACKASIEVPGAVEGAKRRFVLHVIKYETKKGTFNLQEPFQAKVLAWEFTENRFSTLVDIQMEHGNLPQVDLCLGPCENAGFQKYEIIPGGSCQWGTTEERKSQTRQIVANGRSDDLSPLLGRRVSEAEIRGVVNDLVQSWNVAFGLNGSGAMPIEDRNVDNDLSNVLTEDSETTDFFGSDDKPKPEKEMVSANSVPDKSEGIEDLDDLLSGI